MLRHQTPVYPFNWVWWNYMSGSKFAGLPVSCIAYQGIRSYIHECLWTTAERQLQKQCTMLQLPHFSTSHSFSALYYCTLQLLPDFKLLLFWVKRDQLDVTYFIISLFNAQHVSDVNTTILRSQELATYLLSYFMGCIVLTSETSWALNKEIIK